MIMVKYIGSRGFMHINKQTNKRLLFVFKTLTITQII